MGLPKKRVITETQMQNMANPPIAVIFYNSTRNIFIVFDGNIWEEVSTSSGLWNILYYGDFEGGVIPSGMITVDDTSNKFVVGIAEKYAGNYGLYVSNDGGITANYSDSNVCHIYLDIDLPPVMSKWRVRSFWKGVAEINYDWARVYLDETATYVPTANSLPTTSTTLYPIGQSQYNNQSTWIEDLIEMDNSLAGTTVRIIISFTSDGSVTNSPSFCLDNFYIEALV